jgi:hypothetical protein
MNSTSKASPTSPASTAPTARTSAVTPGHRSVLIADNAFDTLRDIQVQTTDPRLDLKDLATAAVELAAEQPGFQESVVARARELLKSRL